MLNDLEELKGRRRKPTYVQPYIDANLLSFAKHQGGMKLHRQAAALGGAARGKRRESAAGRP